MLSHLVIWPADGSTNHNYQMVKGDAQLTRKKYIRLNISEIEQDIARYKADGKNDMAESLATYFADSIDMANVTYHYCDLKLATGEARKETIITSLNGELMNTTIINDGSVYAYILVGSVLILHKLEKQVDEILYYVPVKSLDTGKLITMFIIEVFH